MIKNIHILPTKKSSKFYKVNDNLHVELYPDEIVTAGNHHIYITSDEEILSNNGDYYLGHPNYNFIHKWNMEGIHQGKQVWIKKIILTTDEDLIKNGVQAIDDEFLKWFVKNPSCEEVKINDWLDDNGNIAFGGETRYQIIIPEEECYCDKQETLEEAAEKFRSKNPGTMQGGNNTKIINAFIDGAKWQQERSYSEEEVLELLKKFYQDNNFNGTIVEWFQQFRKK